MTRRSCPPTTKPLGLTGSSFVASNRSANAWTLSQTDRAFELRFVGHIGGTPDDFRGTEAASAVEPNTSRLEVGCGASWRPLGPVFTLSSGVAAGCSVLGSTDEVTKAVLASAASAALEGPLDRLLVRPLEGIEGVFKSETPGLLPVKAAGFTFGQSLVTAGAAEKGCAGPNR